MDEWMDYICGRESLVLFFLFFSSFFFFVRLVQLPCFDRIPAWEHDCEDLEFGENCTISLPSEDDLIAGCEAGVWTYPVRKP